jgi:hypothetical protein
LPLSKADIFRVVFLEALSTTEAMFVKQKNTYLIYTRGLMTEDLALGSLHLDPANPTDHVRKSFRLETPYVYHPHTHIHPHINRFTTALSHRSVFAFLLVCIDYSFALTLYQASEHELDGSSASR